ncbi:porin family protein [Spongiibacter taiwanensis]|uniref:outer membrane beta-barrel protein n=1 Tax=Spongiibacter taiwanensis TaxID=1748242 RepID=UPI002035FE6E|nr:outer membrane beta-barrel protein [Spongiibacter taiwanensis]USA43501.1 porin family protein [Spongiibacter taiwanensis]
MKKTVLMASLAALAASVPAQANHYGRAYNASPTMYFFGGVSSSDYNLSREDVRFSFGDGSLRSIDQDNQSVAWDVGVGYRIGPVLSMEFGYVDLGEFAVSAQSDGSAAALNGYAPGRVDIDASTDGVFLGLNVHTPDSEPVGLFLRGGIYSWEVEGQVQDSARRGRFLVDGVDPFVGAGVRLALDKHIQVQLGYNYYFVDDDSALDFGTGVVGADLFFYF